MSLQVTRVDGTNIEARFLHPASDGVRIADHEFPLEDFSVMATHFLAGGFMGWKDGKTPESVNQALSNLFSLYEQTETGWVRRKPVVA